MLSTFPVAIHTQRGHRSASTPASRASCFAALSGVYLQMSGSLYALLLPETLINHGSAAKLSFI
jgi:hypothetical protein